MGLIEIEGMKFYAYHGHFEAEQVVGNHFIVNLSLETACDAAAASDNLDDALDYQKLYRIVKKEMAIKSHLLEHVCGRVLDHIYADFGDTVRNVKIKISKLNPPMGGQMDQVSVTLMR
ncbi:dihydroneopterin aldolase [Prolixibacteraceae bacterium JC049]|nr:dihydroneopterin aldolase [Prolixibacteraceae bacterium JC049]